MGFNSGFKGLTWLLKQAGRQADRQVDSRMKCLLDPRGVDTCLNCHFTCLNHKVLLLINSIDTPKVSSYPALVVLVFPHTQKQSDGLHTENWKTWLADMASGRQTGAPFVRVTGTARGPAWCSIHCVAVLEARTGIGAYWYDKQRCYAAVAVVWTLSEVIIYYHLLRIERKRGIWHSWVHGAS